MTTSSNNTDTKPHYPGYTDPRKIEFKEIDFEEQPIQRYIDDQISKRTLETLEMIVGHFSSLRFLASMARKDIRVGIKLNEELYKEIEVLQKQNRELAKRLTSLEKKIR